MSTKWPVMAAAAAISGLTRWVRPPLPWRPSKLRFEVEAERSPGARMSGFMPRHIEQPGARHDHRPRARVAPLAADDLRRRPQVLEGGVGARADEDPVDGDVLEG